MTFLWLLCQCLASWAKLRSIKCWVVTAEQDWKGFCRTASSVTCKFPNWCSEWSLEFMDLLSEEKKSVVVVLVSESLWQKEKYPRRQQLKKKAWFTSSFPPFHSYDFICVDKSNLDASRCLTASLDYVEDSLGDCYSLPTHTTHFQCVFQCPDNHFVISMHIEPTKVCFWGSSWKELLKLLQKWDTTIDAI